MVRRSGREKSVDYGGGDVLQNQKREIEAKLKLKCCSLLRNRALQIHVEHHLLLASYVVVFLTSVNPQIFLSVSRRAGLSFGFFK